MPDTSGERGSANAPAKELALVGVNVVHAEHAGAIEAGVTVLIRNGRIASIGHDAPRAGVPIVSLHGKWVIPAFVDAHVHFFQSSTPYTRPDILDLRNVVPYAKDSEEQRARIPELFKSYLRSGVTNVADFGGPMSMFDLRDLAARLGAAPRIFAAGPLVSTKAFPQLDLGDPPMIFVANPSEAAAQGERIASRHPDFIKFLALNATSDKELRDHEAEAVALGNVAREHAITYVVHATQLSMAKAALRAGADVLAHCVFEEADDEFLAMVRRKPVFCTPTLYAMQGYGQVMLGTWQPTTEERRFGPADIVAELSKPAPVSDEIKAWAKQIHFDEVPAAAMENLPRLRDAGMRIVVGTDAGNIGTVHGPAVFREMRLMEKAGLTPREVLIAATLNPAAMLHRDEDLGSVEVGKVADLVVLDRNPLESVDNFSAINSVFKDGVMVVRGNVVLEP